MTITEAAPAKINLALHVRRRRADGYHDLETLFAFAGEGDVVTVARAERHAFAVADPRGRVCERITNRAANLVTRAADAFTAAFGIEGEHQITLRKRLPVASGIGGGSADAAATLRALAKLHAIPATDPRLDTIARTLGADVPACLHGRTALGTGRGDDLQPVDGLPGTPLLLVNPNVAVSTGAVFARWDGTDRGPIGKGDLLARARAGRNDLEPAARALAPAIDAVLAQLAAAPGVLLSRMSGSGATCFALFDTPEARDQAAAAARTRGWWTLTTTLA